MPHKQNRDYRTEVNPKFIARGSDPHYLLRCPELSYYELRAMSIEARRSLHAAALRKELAELHGIEFDMEVRS